MHEQVRLFTRTRHFYHQLISDLASARERISMIYHAYSAGSITDRINAVLVDRAAAGVRVRLLVDAAGQILEEPRNIFANRRLHAYLRSMGITVDVYTPSRAREFLGRHHIKTCAIDDTLMWIGCSNIADHYLTWDDTNLRFESELAQCIHRLYDVITDRSAWLDAGSRINSKGSESGRLCLTLPGQASSIKAALHRVINNARRGIYLRTWYFLPPRAIERRLLSRLTEGVAVNILLSHHTRIPPVDLVNRRVCGRLARAGARIFRYRRTYMHAKVYWNDAGDVLLGSANLEPRGLSGNLECSLALTNPALASKLMDQFWQDTTHCIQTHTRTSKHRFVSSPAAEDDKIDRSIRRSQ